MIRNVLIETCLSHFGKHSFNNMSSYVVRAVDIDYLLGTKAFQRSASFLFSTSCRMMYGLWSVNGKKLSCTVDGNFTLGVSSDIRHTTEVILLIKSLNY